MLVMALLDSVELCSLSLNLSDTSVFEHSESPGLCLGDGLCGACLEELSWFATLAPFASLTRGWLLSLSWLGRDRRGLAQRWEIHVTARIDSILLSHARPQYFRIAEEVILLLHEAGGLFNDNFRFLCGKTWVDLQA